MHYGYDSSFARQEMNLCLQTCKVFTRRPNKVFSLSLDYFIFDRASDKKKTQAAQKAAAQKRLLQPRGGGPNNTGEDTKKSSNDKRKEELVRIYSVYLNCFHIIHRVRN